MSVGKKKTGTRNAGNRRRERQAAFEGWTAMNRRAHEQADRRLGKNKKVPRQGGKSVWATIAMEDMPDEGVIRLGFVRLLFRSLLGMILLPLAWVTSWTFLLTFSHATMREGFWHSAPFWYFAIGVVLMVGWFCSRLAWPLFLYLYVLGHELTHALFVKCFGGKVYDIEWGTEGGYVTTDKSNWVIALSPYFVPFWSVVGVALYILVGLFHDISEVGNCVFYGLVGATWAFHLAWTLWMIPRDQPDLTETGTMLSLVLIYFGNLLVLVGLLCFASPNPLERFSEFGNLWFLTAVSWADEALRWVGEVVVRMMENV